MATRGSERRDRRAAIRADRNGSGPALEERDPVRFPGAGAKFALFGEVLLVGLLVTVVGALVVTLPVALAAGIRHLRRYVAAEDSRVRLFWGDVRRGILPGLVVGLVVAALAVVFLLDIDLARSGFLPGGPVIEIVGWMGLSALAIAVLSLAQQWSPEIGWRGAVRRVPAAIADDPIGAVYLLVAAALVVFLTTSVLVPLFPAALGCALLAAVAVPERRRRRVED